MPAELKIHSRNVGGMCMISTNGEHSVITDYPLRSGEKIGGLTPMELLLCGLAACGGSAFAMLLGYMGQPADKVEVYAKGQKSDNHPQVFTNISLEFVVQGSVESSVVEKALARADEQLCPVWAMLKTATKITTSYTIKES